MRRKNIDPKNLNLSESTFVDKKYGLGVIRKPDFNHKLITRRDFMGHALNAGLSFAVLPSVLSLASRRVYGADSSCAGALTTGMPVRVLMVDKAGGIPMTWQTVIGGEGGQLDYLSTSPTDNAYGKWGLTPGSDYSNASIRDAVIKDFGLKFHPSSSFAEELRNAIPTDKRKHIDGTSFALQSRSDTNSNAMSALRAFAYYGFSGSLTAAAGTEGGSGGRHAEIRGIPSSSPSPITIANTTQARALAGYSALQQIFGSASDPETGKRLAQKILESSQKMSERARISFSNMSADQQADLVVKCGLLDSVTRPTRFVVDNIMTADPFASDAVLRTAFGGGNFGNLPEAQRQAAIMARLLYEGYVGAANVVAGNGDCHANQAEIVPFNEMRSDGQLVGRVIRYFIDRNATAPAGQQISLVVLYQTDGSQLARASRPYTATANGGSYNLTAADGDWDFGNQTTFIYSPLIDNRTANLFRSPVRVADGGQDHGRQIGFFTRDGVPDNSSIFYNDPSNYGAVLTMNLLALFGEEARYTEITGGRNLFRSTAEYEKHLIWKKLFDRA